MNFVWKKGRKKRFRHNETMKVKGMKQSQAHAHTACMLVYAYKTPNTGMNDRPTDPIAMPFTRFLLIINQFRSK